MTGVLTGRRVALIALAFFLAFLIPNLVLIWTALGTFSGVVTHDSYTASQQFDRLRAAQEALGWRVEIEHDEATLTLRITDRNGQAVRPPRLSVTMGRPTTERSDQVLALEEIAGGYAALARFDPGAWRVEINATAADGTAFRQSRDVRVR